MKIIKKERLPLVQCKYCKAVLKIKHEDIIYSKKYKNLKYLNCKCCGTLNKFTDITEILYNEDWGNDDE